MPSTCPWYAIIDTNQVQFFKEAEPVTEETYYTINEAATILGEDVQRLERMVSRGIIRTVQLHGEEHISASELELHQHNSDFS